MRDGDCLDTVPQHKSGDWPRTLLPSLASLSLGFGSPKTSSSVPKMSFRFAASLDRLPAT